MLRHRQLRPYCLPVWRQQNGCLERVCFQLSMLAVYGTVKLGPDCLRRSTCLQVVLLFSDTQIKDESFVEDLSNMLNTCEVPNLMSAGDLAGIFENIRPRAKQAGMDGSRDQLYNFFVQEVSPKVWLQCSYTVSMPQSAWHPAIWLNSYWCHVCPPSSLVALIVCRYAATYILY